MVRGSAGPEYDIKIVNAQLYTLTISLVMAMLSSCEFLRVHLVTSVDMYGIKPVFRLEQERFYSI